MADRRNATTLAGRKPGGTALLDASKSRVLDCREAISELERALEAPAGPALDWRMRAVDALSRLRGAFSDYLAFTEGPDGLFSDVEAHAPRLAHRVERLDAEQREILGLLDVELARALLVTDDPGTMRTRILGVLERVLRHRQHSSDLLWDAYGFDIGIND